MGGLTTKEECLRDILCERALFGGLPDAILDELVASVSLKTFHKGASLFQKGDIGESMIAVLSGVVKVGAVTEEGREVVLNFLRVGDIIGEIAIFDGGPRSASGTMIESGELAIFERQNILTAMKSAPEALLDVIVILCEKLRTASLQVETNQLKADGRLAAGLLRLAELHGRRTERGVEIDLSISQHDLGAFVGLSRENTSRQLSQLSRREVLVLDKRGIVITNWPAIRDLANRAGT